MKRYVMAFTLVALVIGLTYSSTARVQTRTKRTISRIQFYPNWITPPVEYSRLKIRDKERKFGLSFEPGKEKKKEHLNLEIEEFEEEDDFWEHLSFDVTNVSDKTIVYLRTNIYLYTKEGVRKEEWDTGMAIEFGSSDKFEPPYKESLKPGESKTFTASEYLVPLAYAKEQARRLSLPIVKVGIFAVSLFLDDGSNWTFDGQVFPPKPNQTNQNEESNLNSNIPGVGRGEFPVLQ
jgi:hypothetical protein